MTTDVIQVSLLNLPDELLKKVLGECGAGPWRAIPPRLALICRRLLPLAQELLYRCIDTQKSYRKQTRLCRTLDARPDLRQLVRRLFIQGRMHVDSLAVQDRHLDHVDEGEYGAVMVQLPATDLGTLLQLHALRELSLFDVSTSTLNEMFRTGHLHATIPLLERLSLGILLAVNGKECAPEWWDSLAGFPALATLRLFPESGVSIFPASPLSLPSVVSLELNARPFPGAGLPPIADLLPVARRLQLSDSLAAEYEDPAEWPAVDHWLATAPARLESLELMFPYADVAMENYLGRFLHLTTLRLAPGFSLNQTLPLLAKTNITDLSIGVHCRVTDAFLLGLVKGPNRMPHLRCLALQYFRPARVGENLRRILVEEIRYQDAGAPTEMHASLLRRRLAPERPVGCSREGHLAAVERATAAGIAVSGPVLHAIYWDFHFDEQYERAQVDAVDRDDELENLLA